MGKFGKTDGVSYISVILHPEPQDDDGLSNYSQSPHEVIAPRKNVGTDTYLGLPDEGQRDASPRRTETSLLPLTPRMEELLPYVEEQSEGQIVPTQDLIPALETPFTAAPTLW